MNCKYCGKRLSESARFCDRCGEPVGRRTSSGGGSTAKKKPPVSKSTQKKPDSYDRYRKNKMKKETEARRRRRKRRLALVWIILLTIIIAIAAGVYSYTYMLGARPQATEEVEMQQTQTPDDNVQEASTAEPTEEPTEETPSPSPKPTEKSEEDTSGCDIYIDRAYGFKCAYPSSFVTGSLSNNNTRLSLRDSEGDGIVLISYEKISKTDTASSLMKGYVNGLGVDPDFNRASDKWYSVTFSRSGRINHRFAVILSGEQYVYYDFTYEQGTEHKAQYDGYIDYMDKYLQNQAQTKK